MVINKIKGFGTTRKQPIKHQAAWRVRPLTSPYTPERKRRTNEVSSTVYIINKVRDINNI